MANVAYRAVRGAEVGRKKTERAAMANAEANEALTEARLQASAIVARTEPQAATMMANVRTQASVEMTRTRLETEEAFRKQQFAAEPEIHQATQIVLESYSNMRSETETLYARNQSEENACHDFVARLQFVSSDAESATATEEQVCRFAEGLGECQQNGNEI
jgi:hypothetical protein